MMELRHGCDSALSLAKNIFLYEDKERNRYSKGQEKCMIVNALK